METELIFEPKARYLSLHGSFIDRLGEQRHELVNKEHIENREKRDGKGYHVTVINHVEMAKLMPTPTNATNKESKRHLKKSLSQVKETILNTFGSPLTWEKPIDLGLGTTRDKEAVTYFRVLCWPFGQNMRSHLGLGHTNFHITVGFNPRDVHLYKGPATLLCLKQGQSCTITQMKYLISYVGFYYNDRDFIKKLYGTCWRFGYYSQTVPLTRILIQSFFVAMYHNFLKKKKQPSLNNNNFTPLKKI